MCCMKMQKNVGKNINYKYGKIKIGIPIYMDDISKQGDQKR